MAKIEKIKWDTSFSVDIDQIDEHQKKMFDMFNELVDMKNSSADAKDCINQITNINDYSKIYFSSEEKLLRVKKYPDLAAHSKAHRQFTKRFITLRREVSEDIDNLTEETIDELRQWLVAHIKEMDVLYIPFLRISRFVDEAKKNKN